MTTPLRTVYFGSPEFAVPPLQALLSDPAFDVQLVVTQAPKGQSPVERLARGHGVPIYKPDSLRSAGARQPLVDAAADLFVVAAFGLIFRQRTLDIPRFGALNIHPSPLPRYRGASPIMAAVLEGDQQTGVCLMAMDTGIDTGDVVSFEPVVVAQDDTTESLGARLADVAATQLVRDAPRWVSGELRAMPQVGAASLTRTLTKADGQIDWTRPAAELERHVRAMWPWPRAWTTVDDTTLQVIEARVTSEDASGRQPGETIFERKRLLVATGDGALELLTVEPAGRKVMPAGAYLNGRRAPVGRLGSGASLQRPPLVAPLPGDRG
ncbi:MAG: methionyl-tRNA formyltransferase [Thermomicrobiales bacterium]|nr:methionyl-tRNA formyltransferase [Thermomicrobiales bacterium]MCA9879913.1 methionyl-tRNA formyltransferase [Thermomicrobiales bacterium]